jgi:GNAT superfamily N-acetyltransferase
MIREMRKEPDEVVAIYHLLTEMHADSHLALPEIDPKSVVDWITTCAETGKLFVAERDGKIVGALGIFPTKYWFSTDSFLTDRFFYVSPRHRNSSFASRLIDAAEDYALGEGMPLYIGVLSGVDVDRKDTFMVRSGFKRVGGAYMMGV